MPSFLHLDPQPIVTHAEQHGLNLFEVRLQDSCVERVEPSRIFGAMSESYNLLGASPNYMIVVTASNSLDPTRCREGSLSEGEFILVPYNDGGVISCSTMDLPFQSEQYARRADWWKLPARFKHFWRALTDGERGVLDRLLSRDFPGRDELAVQAQNAAVTSIDREGSLRFCVTGPAANIAERVPVEGRYLDGSQDEFGPAVEILLHVVDGKLHELEVLKTDGSEIARNPFEIDPALIQVWCRELREQL